MTALENMSHLISFGLFHQCDRHQLMPKPPMCTSPPARHVIHTALRRRYGCEFPCRALLFLFFFLSFFLSPRCPFSSTFTGPPAVKEAFPQGREINELLQAGGLRVRAARRENRQSRHHFFVPTAAAGRPIYLFKESRSGG